MYSGLYEPNETIPTISNAMDVKNPSNFIRIQEIYNNLENTRKHLSSYSFTDEQTRELMQKVYKNGYTLDPHGAVGYLGLDKYFETNAFTQENEAIFLETAHPVKFLELVEETLAVKLDLSEELQALMKKEKKAISCSNSFNEFTEVLHSIL